MKYAVAGRIYSDYQAARRYADWLDKIAGITAAVEAIEHPTPEFRSDWDRFDDPLKHPPEAPL